jgi:hypothetical protein
MWASLSPCYVFLYKKNRSGVALGDASEWEAAQEELMRRSADWRREHEAAMEAQRASYEQRLTDLANAAAAGDDPRARLRQQKVHCHMIRFIFYYFFCSSYCSMAATGC